MRTTLKSSFLLLIVIIISGCSGGKQDIDYGNDGCHFCKMTIVDKIHGAQLITDKGKVFKFDATECMVNYVAQDNALEIGSLLTNYYESPTAFINSSEATFLISDQLPSPMGANLTAFETKESAEKIRSEKGGSLYTWDGLKEYLRSENLIRIQ